jgi:mannose-6-phosphate isomerase-like protein (cupin superfamily)
MNEGENNIPWWANKYPFPPDKKKPVLIKQEDEIYSNYGRGNDRITVQIFISTDKILLSAWIVPPGQSFQPPDIHTGDEPYYVLKGVATVCNPETGQVVEAKVGDVVFIPAGCWHETYNFGEDDMYLCAIIEGKPWNPEAMKLVEEAVLHPVGYKMSSLEM